MRRLRCRIPGVSAPRDAVCIALKSRDHLGTGVKRERLIGEVTSSRAMRFSAPGRRQANGKNVSDTEKAHRHLGAQLPLICTTLYNVIYNVMCNVKCNVIHC